MALLVIFHPLLRQLYNSLTASSTKTERPDDVASVRLSHRINFDIYFAIILVCILHGFSALKVFAILYINFLLAKGLKRQYIPWAAWIFNVGILFANETFQGYRFAAIMETIAKLPLPVDPNVLVRWGVWLDRHGGLIPRWEVLFNITVLRLISFDMDYYWSLNDRGSSPVEVGSTGPNGYGY